MDEQKVALVTGAGRGIGRAIAIALAREGFSLGLAARTPEQLEETRRLTGLTPERSLIVLIDLAEDQGPEALFTTALDHFKRVDVLINNAGWGPARTALHKTSAADQDRMLALNLRAPIALTRLAAAAMLAQGSGAIINVASAAGRASPPLEAIYAATKAGLIAFTRACFAELRHGGVKVAVVIPGLVDTALIPVNKRLERARMITPEQVAAAVMQIVNSPAAVCPVEVALEPQLDPERAR